MAEQTTEQISAGRNLFCRSGSMSGICFTIEAGTYEAGEKFARGELSTELDVQAAVKFSGNPPVRSSTPSPDPEGVPASNCIGAIVGSTPVARWHF
jgi:hypothetical protein